MQDPVQIRLASPLATADGCTIDAVTLARPTVAALKGLQLAMVQVQDVSAICRLLPRITTPALTPAQVESLDPADFAALANRVSLFFMSPEQLAQMQAAALPGLH
jgi:hypothetical protein